MWTDPESQQSYQFHTINEKEGAQTGAIRYRREKKMEEREEILPMSHYPFFTPTSLSTLGTCHPSGDQSSAHSCRM
jgi:hypothetical protein